MMQDVVNEAGGTGALARLEGYSVAGKTGTASKPEKGGYSDSRYVASFVGVVPANAPRLVVLVVGRRAPRRDLGRRRGRTGVPGDRALRAPVPGDPAGRPRCPGANLAVSMSCASSVRRCRPPRSSATTRCEIADLAYAAGGVRPGALFFCIPGSRADGHDFAAAALEHGAVALVGRAAAAARRPAGRPRGHARGDARPPRPPSSGTRRASSRWPA